MDHEKNLGVGVKTVRLLCSNDRCGRTVTTVNATADGLYGFSVPPIGSPRGWQPPGKRLKPAVPAAADTNTAWNPNPPRFEMKCPSCGRKYVYKRKTLLQIIQQSHSRTIVLPD